MNTSLIRRLMLSLPFAALIAASAVAQPVTPGPFTGTYEFTLGGNGVANKNLDDSLGGVSVSFGKYVTETLQYSLRQTVNYSNPQSAGTTWNGSTFFAVDQHFGTTAIRPFVGANVGAIYGEGVSDTWGAGLEAGVKYYVQPRTFVFAMVQYAWLFDEGDEIDNRFSQGQYSWNFGVGFHF